MVVPAVATPPAPPTTVAAPSIFPIPPLPPDAKIDDVNPVIVELPPELPFWPAKALAPPTPTIIERLSPGVTVIVALA